MSDLNYYAMPQAVCKRCEQPIFKYDTWYHHHNQNMVCQMGAPLHITGIAEPVPGSIYEPQDEDLPLSMVDDS